MQWDEYFLLMAQLTSMKSKDPSTKCGAVITDSMNRVLGCGYNGFPMGMSDDMVLYKDRGAKYSRVIHAEMNALLMARGGLCCYTWPFLPCDRCTVHLLQSGIRRFCVPLGCEERAYHRTSMEYMDECGAKIIHYPLTLQLNVSENG